MLLMWSAFKFGHLDAKASEDTDSTKLLSYKAMQEFASQNEQVRITLGKEREESARMDFAEEDWKKQLEYNRQGILINNLKNLLLILNNDENLKGIVFNQLSDDMEIKGEVEPSIQVLEGCGRCTADFLYRPYLWKLLSEKL